MTATVIYLSLAYVVLAVLLLGLNLRSGWHWGVKAAAIAATSVCYGVTYFGMQGLLGWPSETAIPAAFRFIAADVREPDRRRDYAGEIYLWVSDMRAEGSTPRAYQLAYSSRLHESIEQARQAQSQGRPQYGEAVARTSSGWRPPWRGSWTGIVRFHEVARRPLPAKR